MSQFNMPQLGETVTEGTITRWLKKEGDSIEADEGLLEVSTDKVDSEIPAPQAGTLAKILAQEGETVAVGTPIAQIASAGESLPHDGAAADASPAGSEATPASRPDEEPDVMQNGTQTAAAAADASPAGSEATPASRSDEEPDAIQNGTQTGAAPAEAQRRPAERVLSPLVRKLAAQKNVDLAAIEGTGTGGRITREDVLRYAGDTNGAASVPSPAGHPATERPSDSPVPRPVPSQEPKIAPGKGGADEKVPLSNMRRLIAEHMVASVHETARAWNTVEVDMTTIGGLRKAAAGSYKSAFGYSLTWTPFVARALSQALLEFPQVNSSWNGDGTITKKHYVNLGIAVAVENGLIVPVIKGADQMNLLGLAAAIRDVAERARRKKLTADEIKEGTFTLTNPGPFGSIMSVPIINRGEAAILAFDAIVKRPVVITAADGSDSIAIREMVFLSLSWDHRLIDGAEAARFLSRLKTLVEQADFRNDLAPYLH